jgi:uncharacterized membrane protein YeaQ/YmgE (transglycosylase-associated protein family)
MIGIISWLVLGVIAGLITVRMMPGRDTGLMAFTTAIGVAGAVAGAFLGVALGIGGMAVFSLYSLLFATFGSILALLSYRRVVGA